MNEAAYKTVGKGEAELIEKRSRFIGCLTRAETEEEARGWIAAVRAQYPNATHYVYCYSLRAGNTIRFSDDGEPQGTAGRPALDLLTRAGVVDFCLVVVRYFGGTLLGAGGLTRAYAAAARNALDAGGTVLYAPHRTLDCAAAYPDWPRVEHWLKTSKRRAHTLTYGEAVTFTLYIPAADADAAAEQLRALTAGRCSPAFGAVTLRPADE